MSELSSVELIALNLCQQEQLEDGYPVSVSLDQVEGAALYRTRARGLIAALAEADRMIVPGAEAKENIASTLRLLPAEIDPRHAASLIVKDLGHLDDAVRPDPGA